MSKHQPPMWNDPKESQLVRELLRAGRSAGSEGYDVRAGLLKHMAHIKAGTPAPSWASQPLTSAAGAASSGASLSLWGVVAVSVLGAAAGVMMWSDTSPPPSTKLPVATKVATSPEIGLPQPPESVLGPMEVVPSVPAAANGTEPAATTDDNVRDTAIRRRSPRVSTSQGLAVSQADPGTTGLDGRATDVQDRGARSPSGLVAAPTSSVSPSNPAVPRAAQPTLDEVVTRAVRATEATTGSSAAAMQPKVAAGSVTQPEAAPGTREELLEREMRMLKVAQAVLDTDPARSLRLAEMGEREFKGSMFTQERQYVLIVALARLGRTAEAHRLAAEYLQSYPNGPFSERVRKALSVR